MKEALYNTVESHLHEVQEQTKLSYSEKQSEQWFPLKRQRQGLTESGDEGTFWGRW